MIIDYKASLWPGEIPWVHKCRLCLSLPCRMIWILMSSSEPDVTAKTHEIIA